MPKRTTLVLDDAVYEKLVRESMKKYGNARNISKVVNDLVGGKKQRSADLMKLIYSKKVAKTTAREFEQFRKKALY
jgi:predicted CopG family antitoxin